MREGLDKRVSTVLHDLADGKVDVDAIGNLIRDLVHALRMKRDRYLSTTKPTGEDNNGK